MSDYLITTHWPCMTGDHITYYRYDGVWYITDDLPPDLRGLALPYTDTMIERYNERMAYAVQVFAIPESEDAA